jgi:hypothetical protein
VVNAFNLASKGIIFQKLYAIGGDIIQLIPFVRVFYAFEFPLFYSHHNHEGKATIIPSGMGTCQGDPLGGALFILAYFIILHYTTSHFPFYLFPFITNVIRIISPPLIVSFTHEHFQTKLCMIGFFIQPQKCATWSPFTLLLNFNTPSLLNTPSKGIMGLGVPLGISSFTSSFIKDVLLEDVQHVDLLRRMGNVQVVFGILIHCFV